MSSADPETPDPRRTRLAEDSASFARIERAIAYLRSHRARQPALGDVAAHIGLSESQTQRLFTRWAGVSPKRFLQYLTVEYAKQRMRDTGDLLDTALDAGLSGPGRLHDLFVHAEALTPGQFRRAAQGVVIRYGSGPTPFGEAWVAIAPRGICHLGFAVAGAADTGPGGWLEARRRAWPEAEWHEDHAAARRMLAAVFARDPGHAARGLALWLSGTNFQLQVWRAMLRLPPGGLVSYGQLAAMVGRPAAARSVGSAVARNPIAYLIPCHRVLRAGGEFGEYHWGGDRKVAMCGWEASTIAHGGPPGMPPGPRLVGVSGPGGDADT